MASFDCYRCNGKKLTTVIIIEGNKAHERLRQCPVCLGTGILDNFGKSKRF